MRHFVSIFVLLFFFSCAGNKEERVSRSQPEKPVAYQLASVERGGVPTVIKLPAQLAAYQEVSIFPKLNAYVRQVLVDVGSPVQKGSVLMVLEAPEMEQTALQAKEKYARAKADHALEKEHYLRLLEAAKTPGAVSPMDLSAAKSRMDADSAIANAEKASWQMQQNMMGYLRVVAPFAGIITERNVHPGALVSTATKDKPMLELKQVDHLRLQVDVPENIVTTLRNKDTVFFTVSALPGKRMTGFISRRSMNMNAQFRSERMEIDVPNGIRNLAPGMYADVLLYSNGNTGGLWVPRSAVVTSTERRYVLLVKNDHIRKIDIGTGNQTADKVEVFGELMAGDKVILNANDEIKETR